MELAYYCMDNPEHIFSGKNLDGVRCPYCEGLVRIKPVRIEEYEKLPKYREIKKHMNSELKKQSCISKDLTIDLGFDDKTILKLRAIAKHAGALADELDAIDNGWVCECGSTDYQDTILCSADTDEVVMHERLCNVCRKVISMHEDLPTRFEGSE